MKLWTIALLLSLILLACIISSWFIFKKYYLNDMVHAGIEEQISEQIENDFHFTMDNVSINLLSSRAQLTGINLLLLNQSDTVGYFKGDIQIDVRGWRNLIFDTQKQIKNIDLKETDIYYAADHPLIMKNKDENGEQEVKINNVSAIGKVLFANKHKEQSGQLSTRFDVAAAPNFNSSKEYSVDYLINKINDFQVSQFHYYMPDGFYQLMISDISFSNFDDIALNGVIINSIYSRKTFAEKKELATDNISVSIDSIQLIDFDRRLDEHVFIDQIKINQPSIDVYKDNNYPPNMDFTPVLVDLLKEIETPVYVRTAEINSMFIKYTELAEGAEEPGYLFFSEAEAGISNITNVKDSLQYSRNMLIDAQAKFYGAGKLNASFKYDLLSSTGEFGVKGSLSPMDIGKANAIISKLEPARIKSGQVEKLKFNFSGTSTHSTGDMWFEYSDLNLEVTDVKYWNNRFTRSVINSAGNWALRNSNPAPNGSFRVGAIDQDRDKTKSMFNYWWICLRSGFFSTLNVETAKAEIDFNSEEAATLSDKIGEYGK